MAPLADLFELFKPFLVVDRRCRHDNKAVCVQHQSVLDVIQLLREVQHDAAPPDVSGDYRIPCVRRRRGAAVQELVLSQEEHVQHSRRAQPSRVAKRRAALSPKRSLGPSGRMSASDRPRLRSMFEPRALVAKGQAPALRRATIALKALARFVDERDGLRGLRTKCMRG